jgi:glycosyltransferase involved in cell wall biosynthesis
MGRDTDFQGLSPRGGSAGATFHSSSVDRHVVGAGTGRCRALLHQLRGHACAASDPDCDKSRVRLLVPIARDRWLYAQGLRRADAILVQSASQAEALARSYGLASRVAGMLVEALPPPATRDIDVLWVGNIQWLKRPDRVLELADRIPQVKIHMVGAPMSGQEVLFRKVAQAAAAKTNVVFHGRLSYRDTNDLYGRAKVLVNTSDIEGFPNSYLQAWIRGVPVVTLIDPDRVIERQGLGVAVRSPGEIADAIRRLVGEPAAWKAASDRCRAFMAQEYGEDKVLRPYLETFDEIMSIYRASANITMSSEARHV